MSAQTMRLWNDCVTGGCVRPKLKVLTKTASYTITPEDFGTVFTTRGASGTVTFTLPSAGVTNKGDCVFFLNLADVSLVVAGAEGGLVIFNNLTADSISLAESGELIGGAFFAVSDATSWIVLPIATETQTLSVDSTSTATATSTPTGTPTSTSTPTGTPTSTSTPTGTASSSTTGTGTSTSTSTASASESATASPTITESASASASATSTSTGTPTSTSSSTGTGTSTSTSTGTGTTTTSKTGTSTSTATATGTP